MWTWRRVVLEDLYIKFELWQSRYNVTYNPYTATVGYPKMTRFTGNCILLLMLLLLLLINYVHTGIRATNTTTTTFRSNMNT